MIAIVTSYGQEFAHYNVTAASADTRGYLTLDLDAHPSRVNFYRPGGRTAVLLAATGEDLTALLRERTAARTAAHPA